MSDRPAITERAYESLDSTQLEARRLIKGGEIGGAVVVVSGMQTGGLGRAGKPWASPPGGLWCTLAWPLPDDAGVRDRIVEGLGLRLGLACAGCVRAWCESVGSGVDVGLKWPNDVLADGRKVAGILTEVIRVQGRAWALVGVGINANVGVGALPEALRERAGSLRELAGCEVDVAALRAELVAALAGALLRGSLTVEEMRDAERVMGLPEGSVGLMRGGVRVLGEGGGEEESERSTKPSRRA